MRRTTKLSRTQAGIYIEWVMHPDRTTYNLPYIIRIPDKWTDEQIVFAVRTMTELYPILTASLTAGADGEAELLTGEAAEIETVTLERDPEWENLVRPFAVSGECLSRFELIHTLDGRFLFADIHHIVADGMSLNVFWKGFSELLNGKTPEGERMTFETIAAEEEAARHTDAYEHTHEFFRSLLDGFDPDCAPAPDSEQKTEEQGWLTLDFELEEDRLRALKKEEGISKSAFFASALGFLTARYSAVKQSVISMVYSDRADPEKAYTMDMLVKTLPFVTDTETHPEVLSLLKAAQENLSGSRENAVCSFMDLAKEFGLQNDVSFGYQGSILDFQALLPEGFEMTRLYDKNGSMKKPVGIYHRR